MSADELTLQLSSQLQSKSDTRLICANVNTLGNIENTVGHVLNIAAFREELCDVEL